MTPTASHGTLNSGQKQRNTPLLVGYGALGLLIVTILSWSAIVPLADSIVVPGTVSVAAQRRTIAHLEGGKVSKLNVSEGDYVEADQILLELDDKDVRSRLDVLEFEHFAHQAKLEHLEAERAGKVSIAFDSVLYEQAEAEFRYFEVLRGEISALEARQRTFQTRSALLQEQIRQGNEQLDRFRQQLRSLDRQHLIIRQQLEDAERLLAKGYGTRSRAVELRLENERVLSRRFTIEAEIDDVVGTIKDARLGKDQLLAERSHDIEDKLAQTRRKLVEINGQIREALDRAESFKIRSTVQGVVVDLKIQSVNDVIRPASTILDISPIDSTYLVEVQMPSDKIKSISEGMEADVQLHGVDDQWAQSIPGRVVLVSADIANDPNAQRDYYRIHVLLAGLQKSNNNINIIPGMPANVIFQKRDRTVVEYFLEPLMSHLAKSAL